MARANLAVDNRLYEDFSLIARQRNKTLFAFANEAISAICKICNEGGTVSDVYPLEEYTEAVAKEESIRKLTEEHSKVIKYLSHYCLKFDSGPLIRPYLTMSGPIRPKKSSLLS